MSTKLYRFACYGLVPRRNLFFDKVVLGVILEIQKRSDEELVILLGIGNYNGPRHPSCFGFRHKLAGFVSTCQTSLFKDFIKLSLPTFDGKSDPTTTEKWLKDIKNIFTTIGMSTELCVAFVVYKLFDGATNWWKTIKLSCQDTGLECSVMDPVLT
ncbi:hypothetical protein PanWU01x14_354200 [Parasponia andersonii]|uniref:Uncharacterized protein n=1 Tax=Parasponia andersonii TaxID=3476 RepID=A0A2P5A9R5_PARAD|nr:hypothetical protein PanWU01x14_354200 [Parasponia andersonii]